MRLCDLRERGVITYSAYCTEAQGSWHILLYHKRLDLSKVATKAFTCNCWLTGRNCLLKALIPPCFAEKRRLSQSEEHDLFARKSADVVVHA
jgi:hypothetical protein